MAKLNLSDIVGNRAKDFVTQESNIEQGQIFNYHISHWSDQYAPCLGEEFCWRSPGNGCAVVEIWGAGGSAGEQCCCSAGVPGNPGTYLKKIVKVDNQTWMRGKIGIACSANLLCFKGCSQSTCAYMCSPNGLLNGGCGDSNCICFCAEGGMGGFQMCHTAGDATVTCFQYQYTFGVAETCGVNRNFCSGRSGPPINCNSYDKTTCGIVCNVGWTHPRYAYGGDINCNSGDPNDPNGAWSCLISTCCDGSVACNWYQSIAIPAGIFSTDGSVITVQGECWNSGSQSATGSALTQLLGGLSSLGRQAGYGVPPNGVCWSGASRTCGCYEWYACYHNLPVGVPAPASQVAVNVRNHGARGGSGGVRIKYIGGNYA